MKIKVTGKHTDIGEALTNHVHESLTELFQKHFKDAINIDVTIEKKHHQFYVDVDAHVSAHLTLNSHAHSPDAYGAVDAATHKLERRLKRHKNKLKDDIRHSRAAVKEAMTVQKRVLDGWSDDELEDEKHPAIIAETKFEIPTISVSQAVELMDLQDMPTVIFKNAANNELNVVFRRKDGNIGWVDPTVIIK